MTLIERLSRDEKGPLNARIWLNAAGQVCINLEGGGGFTLEESSETNLYYLEEEP